jgi:hypothetical protein
LLTALLTVRVISSMATGRPALTLCRTGGMTARYTGS